MQAPRVPAVLALVLLSGCSGGDEQKPPACDPVPLRAALDRPGPIAGGRLLPNGDELAPMGERLLVGQAPMHLVVAPDGVTVALAEFGLRQWGVEFVRAEPGVAMRRLSLEPLGATRPGGYLRGLAFDRDGARIYAANTGADAVATFSTKAGDVSFSGTTGLGGQWPADLVAAPDGRVFVSFAASNEIHAYDGTFRRLWAKAPTSGQFPHAMLLAGDRLYVAEMGAAAGQRNLVEAFDTRTLAPVARWPVGKNPSALALSPDGRTLYVAASDDDWIDRIDLASGALLQPFMLEMPQDPAALPVPSTVQPSSLAVSPDGATLYVAAGALNAVLLLDARTGLRRGAIPTGWRPTSIALAEAGRTLLVANLRGEGSRPSGQPIEGVPDGVIPGSLQRVAPIPAGEELAAATETVARLLRRPQREFAAPDPRCERLGPLPARRDGPGGSAFAHVVVVLKGAKTFDELFGDLPGAEGDPNLLAWKDLTPNQNALARQFCVLDNFYAGPETLPGAHYAMAAQTATDWFERAWSGADPQRLATTAPLAEALGGTAAIERPRAGFIWDALDRAGVGFTSFGEFAGLGPLLAQRLEREFAETPADQLRLQDTYKVSAVLDYVKAGKLPAFSFVALGGDAPRASRTSSSAVANNDLATGQLVDAISKSRYWADTLILVTYDGAGSGPDHVDRRRTPALVVSPYARRGRVSHVRGSFASLAATWERALGVKPLSRYDGAAEPVWDCLTGKPDLSTYTLKDPGPSPNPAGLSPSGGN